MNPTHLLLRYGELFLKGQNRPFFERQLQNNIRHLTGRKARRIQGRLLLDYFPEHQVVRRVFGLVSYSLAMRVEKDVEIIKAAALTILPATTKTFKVEVVRSDKSFPIKSPELKVTIGRHLEAHSKAAFQFQNPQWLLNIEINQDGAYLFTETISCLGGLPVGSSGKVLVVLEDEASILAGLLMMKRGCTPIPVGEGDITLLQQFSPQEIECLKEIPFNAVVVSGQNFENTTQIPGMVLRPLIAYHEEQIQEELEKYKTVP